MVKPSVNYTWFHKWSTPKEFNNLIKVYNEIILTLIINQQFTQHIRKLTMPRYRGRFITTYSTSPNSKTTRHRLMHSLTMFYRPQKFYNVTTKVLESIFKFLRAI